MEKQGKKSLRVILTMTKIRKPYTRKEMGKVLKKKNT